MKTCLTVFAVIVLHAAVLAADVPENKPTTNKAPAQTSAVALYDTGAALPEPGAAPFTIEAEKWTKIADGAVARIKGDAVLCNRYTAAVVRKDGAGVDLYAHAAGGWAPRARLALLAGPPAATPAAQAGVDTVKFAGTTSVPGDGSSAAVTVKTQGSGTGSLEFSVTAESPLLKATAKGKADGLRISAPCRWGVLPDFFTDDMMVDARQISTSRVEIPIEHIYLQMLDDGNSILAVFRDKGERDIQVSLSGEGEQRVMKDADIFFGGDGGSIWAGTLEYKGIWHCCNFSKEDDQKWAKLNWDVPFDANWKGNFSQADNNVHSAAISPWITWTKNAPKKGVANIIGNRGRPWRDAFEAEGPLLVYPLRRNDQTPLDILLLDDFMRLSLGSGPCAFILDAEGRKGVYKGIFTCSYAWTIPRMVSDAREDLSFLKEERVMARTIHKSVVTFMEFIESRIGLYADLRKEILAMLDAREKQNPDLAGFIGKLKKIAATLPEKAPAGSRPIASSLQVVEKAILLDTPGQIAVSRQEMGRPPQVAEPQDNQLAWCRNIAKTLRARAISEFVRDPVASKNPAAAEIVKEIREKTQAVIHGPASHEGWDNW
jgi:hypothetical protein